MANKTKEKTCSWIAPSNIALVKYWGKRDLQIPLNPSVSMTLKHSLTETNINWSVDTKQEKYSFTFLFEDQISVSFNQKIEKFFDRIKPYFSTLDTLKMNISSRNTFPHSTGIASSASSFAALALCLVEIEYIEAKKENEIESDDFFKKASFLARLGSGSACRSILANYALWGNVDEIEESSNEHASSLKAIAPLFYKLNDLIIIVDDSPKEVSSTIGHALMDQHLYRDTRIKEAKINLESILLALKSGDFDLFGRTLEKEAMSLHAMMMTSEQPYILLKPDTLKVIEKVKQFRKDANIPIYFTLDAGPNIHLIYSNKHTTQVKKFYQMYLKDISINCIDDRIGLGPKRIC